MRDASPELHEFWNSFSADRVSKAVPEEASGFAEWVHARLAPETTIIDVGFGNARDSLWFARHGSPVRGYDFAESAVDAAQQRASAESLDARFYDAAAVKQVADSSTASIYGRFLIHSLTDEGRLNLFDLAPTGLGDAGSLYLEFRTGGPGRTSPVRRRPLPQVPRPLAGRGVDR